MDSRRIRALNPTINQPDLDTILFLNSYARYRGRGGHNELSEFQRDYRNTSPNPANMRPGQPYRTWFAHTVMRESEHHTTDHGFAHDQYIAYRRTNNLPGEGLRQAESCPCLDPLCGRSHHQNHNTYMLQHRTGTTTAPDLLPYEPEQLSNPTIPTAVTAFAHLDTGAESCTGSS